MITDKRVGVLMGGTSAEREVSLRSGAAVMNALMNLGLDVRAIDAGRDVCAVLKREGIEVAFLALHGGFGEDGSIQGLLEVMGIPYTGSGVLASALAMDKAASKKIFSHHGIPSSRFKVMVSSEDDLGGFDTPLVVKPRREGSSVGVSIIRKAEDIREALMKALSFGGEAIVEDYLEGKEVQIGILGERALGGVEVRPKLEFYNYEAKYTPGLTEYILPPELDDASYERCREAALGAHRALGCSGATRVDLIVDRRGAPYVLEVNTIPGLTETSLLPKIAKLAGMDFPALMEEMLRDAISGWKERVGGGRS